MMSLNSSRSRRVTDGTTSGKRGRPESIVRQYWEDIGVPNVGPKCIFCDHRSVTRLFRAPPATRHTLICKNAPEHVKDTLRRVTNNKYSRRPPLSTEVSAQATAAAAVAASKSLPHVQVQVQQQQQHPQPHHQQHRTQHPHQQQQQQQQHHPTQPLQHHQPQPQHHQTQGHPQHHQPQHHQQHHPQPQQAQPTPVSQQPQQPQFSFKTSPPPQQDPHSHDPTSIPNLASPRHISANVVSSINGNSPAAMNSSVDAGVVPGAVRSAILNDPRTVAATPRSIGIAPSHAVASAALSPATTDILYAGGSAQRLLHQPTDDLTSPATASLERANAALASAVIEAMFPPGSGRKKDGPVPTPAEFRAALHDTKETARNKTKRQRNEARAESARLQNAISLLVASKTIGGANDRTVDAVESDDSDDDMATHVGNHMTTPRRHEWSNGYDRAHKMER